MLNFNAGQRDLVLSQFNVPDFVNSEALIHWEEWMEWWTWVREG